MGGRGVLSVASGTHAAHRHLDLHYLAILPLLDLNGVLHIHLSLQRRGQSLRLREKKEGERGRQRGTPKVSGSERETERSVISSD